MRNNYSAGGSFNGDEAETAATLNSRREVQNPCPKPGQFIYPKPQIEHGAEFEGECTSQSWDEEPELSPGLTKVRTLMRMRGGHARCAKLAWSWCSPRLPNDCSGHDHNLVTSRSNIVRLLAVEDEVGKSHFPSISLPIRWAYWQLQGTLGARNKEISNVQHGHNGAKRTWIQ
jgi:hypothetical protein